MNYEPEEMMKKEILFVLLNHFADWEGAYIAPSLNYGVEPGSEKNYVVNRIYNQRPIIVFIGINLLLNMNIGFNVRRSELKTTREGWHTDDADQTDDHRFSF